MSRQIEAALKPGDYRIITTANSKELITHAKDADVIFTEIPEGLRFIRPIKGPLIIGITKTSDEAVLQQASKAGINDVLRTPIIPTEVLIKTENCLRVKSALIHLENEIKNLETIIEVTSIVSSTLNPKEILFLVVKKISEIIPVTRCSIIRIDSETRYALVISSFENPKIGGIKLDLKKYPEIMQAITSRKPVVIKDVDTDPIMKGVRDIICNLGIRSILVLPIIFKDEVIGTLFLRTSRSGRSFADEEIKLCHAIANASANALNNAFLYEKMESEMLRLERLAITDFLTGIYNIRYFYHRLEEEFSRSQRYASPISCLMFDIDHFKQINDTYGHKRGDMALRELSTVLKKSVRKSDILARYGGEEFILLLPNTNLDGAKAEAERIRDTIKKHVFKSLKGERKITISIGIAALPHKKIQTSDDLITCADSALFKAKKSGRNQVVIFS